MVFMCQNDSYLQSFTTSISSCQPAEHKICDDGVTSVIEGFEVELEDTILFPEGGGQPDDRGTINGKPVLKVYRVGAKALHFLSTSFDAGTEVELEVDWKRRFDHMQQHSGQHLISAIADQKFGFKTTSWDLGKNVSFIELDSSAVTQQQIEEIEKKCNEFIRSRTEVVVHTAADVSQLPDSVRSRGLPLDHVGAIRTIEIVGVDNNMCCGTHVVNLSHLQLVKLLHPATRGKKGKTNLHFLVGGRVSEFVDSRSKMDKDMTKSLKCGPDQFAEAVERTVKQLRIANKSCTGLLRELAVFEAEKINSEFHNQGTLFFSLHRNDGNNEYMNIIANKADEKVFLLLTVGEERGAGMFLIRGSEEFVAGDADAIREMLEGKGVSKGRTMRGKAGSLKRRKEALKLMQTFVSSHQFGDKLTLADADSVS